MIRYFFIFLLIFLNACTGSGKKNSDEEWRLYGNDGNRRFSSAGQITVENVSKMQPAWEFSTGDTDPRNNLQLQCHPIMVNGKLYVTSGRGKVYALDAVTGEQIWSFDALKDSTASEVNRGVVYWEDDQSKNRRIFFCARSDLFALDADNGSLINSFGDSGRIDLRKNLDREDTTLSVVATTPGVIYKDLLIIGGRVSEGPGKGAPGHIRAFNVLTGKREWIFHTIPHPGEYGYETWPKDAWKYAGGANAWTGMTVDAARGTVFVPLGSPSFDFYGGDRKGMNLFGNCLLALDAATGKRQWHFQTVHHDIWDRDLPSPPVLIRVKKDGKMIDAVAQVTKTGFVYVFNRDSGESLFPIEERPVPPSSLPGEEAWPTQPYPTKPAPFVRQLFTDQDISDLDTNTKAYISNRIQSVRRSHMFEPPSLEGTVILPGFDGGGEWGGAAFDERSGTMYVNGNEMAWILTMFPRSQGWQGAGRTVYLNNCAGCHGPELKGAPPAFPALDTITPRLDSAAIAAILNNGRGRMNAFKHLADYQKKDVINYLLNKERTQLSEGHRQAITKNEEQLQDYLSTGYHRFFDDNGYPALTPPWGTLNAIDLNEGKILWTVPLGELKELTAKGIPPTGTENYGGPLITASGVLFIAASKDEKFRAFDMKTGKILWEYQLPAGGYATPTTYVLNGKQYVVIAAGGGKMGTKSGNKYLAFALPEKN
jgi:quinoprotein glucose dehydrogenase